MTLEKTGDTEVQIASSFEEMIKIADQLGEKSDCVTVLSLESIQETFHGDIDAVLKTVMTLMNEGYILSGINLDDGRTGLAFTMEGSRMMRLRDGDGKMIVMEAAGLMPGPKERKQ